MKTPLTIITGSLGSGKTTLLKHILDSFPKKIAILMNEFGEIAIDSKIIKGKNVEMAELAGGCVCCSLIGEFEEAVEEIIDRVDPDFLVLETTGLAEPDSLIVDVQESLPRVRLDGVITVVDLDMMVRFPKLGKTTKMQIEDADLLLLNKIDLVSEQELSIVISKLLEINPKASIIKTHLSQADCNLLFGLSRKKDAQFPAQTHTLEFESISIRSERHLDRNSFTAILNRLPANIIRAKGFVNFENGTYLLNYVCGRWELEPFKTEKTALVFIGKNLDKDLIVKQVRFCEI